MVISFDQQHKNLQVPDNYNKMISLYFINSTSYILYHSISQCIICTMYMSHCIWYNVLLLVHVNDNLQVIT